MSELAPFYRIHLVFVCILFLTKCYLNLYSLMRPHKVQGLEHLGDRLMLSM